MLAFISCVCVCVYTTYEDYKDIHEHTAVNYINSIDIPSPSHN